MRTSILFTLAAGLFASAVAAQDTQDGFEDPVSFGFYHTKGDKTHFKTITGNNQVTDLTANKSVLGSYLIGGVDQKITFEWSPDTARVPIQECTAGFSADPKIGNVKWDLDDGAGALAPIQNPPTGLVIGSAHVECKPKL